MNQEDLSRIYGVCEKNEICDYCKNSILSLNVYNKNKDKLVR